MAEEPDVAAARRYFSGDDDIAWQGSRGGVGAGALPPPEGVSSSTIVSGLVAARRQDHAVSCCCPVPPRPPPPPHLPSEFTLVSEQWLTTTDAWQMRSLLESAVKCDLLIGCAVHLPDYLVGCLISLLLLVLNDAMSSSNKIITL